MRFLHTADCHLGGHRDPKLRALIEEGFTQLIDDAIKRNVDFVLIAGDLFNTALPGIETLKFTVTQLGRLKEKNIPVYAIPGSHDYSPSGKTILDVLERANLLTNVSRMNEDGTLIWTKDQKTGVKLTGILGMRGMLDRHAYEQLAKDVETGERIFLFHTAIHELAPMPGSMQLELLPTGCRYYAGGHVHIRAQLATPTHSLVAYPGPLVPNSFSEFEELGHGGYILYEDGTLTRVALNTHPVVRITIDANGTSGAQANEELMRRVREATVADAIVTLRLSGTLASGSPADIDVRAAARELERQGAYTVLRSSAQLTAPALTMEGEEREHHDVENDVLEQHREQLTRSGADGVATARALLRALEIEPGDGEKLYAYQERIVQEARELLTPRTQD